MINLKSLLNDSYVQKTYSKKGLKFAGAVSFLYMGECVGFEKRLNKWGSWEKEYSRRGYKTLALDDFLLAVSGEDISRLFGQKLSKDEKPIYHAEIYRDIYLGKVTPVIDLEKMMNTHEPQFGFFKIPSTKNPDSI